MRRLSGVQQNLASLFWFYKITHGEMYNHIHEMCKDTQLLTSPLASTTTPIFDLFVYTFCLSRSVSYSGAIWM